MTTRRRRSSRNGTPTPPAARGDRKLVLEPRIEKLKVVSGGARFWAGALAGDSYVVMKFRIVEQPSGNAGRGA